MIDIDAAVRAMRDADPVPDPESLRRFMVDGAVFLDATKERTMEIQTDFDAVETQKTPVPLWRRAMPALVAAAVVILVGAAILLLARDTEPDVAGIPQTSSEPTATYTGGACDYDGPSEFALNTQPTFTVINESETTEVGFSLWKFPEGVTPEEILEQGIFEFVTPFNSPSFILPPTAIGEPGTLRAFLDSPGQWGISCFDQSGGENVSDNYVTMFTVNG
jgi:hypothetical protein